MKRRNGLAEQPGPRVPDTAATSHRLRDDGRQPEMRRGAAGSRRSRRSSDDRERRRGAVVLLASAVAIAPTLGAAALPSPRPSTPADDPAAVAAAARDWRQGHERDILAELVEFLAIPNVAADLDNIRRKAAWIVDAFGRRGIDLELLETGGAPYVFGERRVEGADRTLLFYCHYDGQAVDRAAWVGHDPWEPVFRDGRLEDGAGILARSLEELPEGTIDPDWRIYSRSASDDSSPIVMILTALDALQAAGIEPRANLKFLFEGDEEAGSPNVTDAARRWADRWAADFMIIADGPKHPSGLPTLSFGVRGIETVQLTVYGPAQPLHSGHFGNWAPNPAMRLAQLLATMKDPDTGEVLVAGWNDDREPLSPTERRALEALPDDPARSPAALGFAAPEGPWERRVEAITYNSLNVRGMRSAWVGDESRTIVPDRAVAEIDFRLVVDTPGEAQVERFVEHVRAQGFHVVREEPDADTRARHPKLARVVTTEAGYPAVRTSMDLPLSGELRQRLRRAFDAEPVAYPTSGGSLPLHAFKSIVGVDPVTVPVVNHDNNQHSPNENVRVGNVWDGIEILAVLLTL